MAESEPRDVLAFWFSDEGKPHWFKASAAFDARVREQLGLLYLRAARGELDGWRERPDGALALVLLLDQAPRNIHRGTADAFATDAKALEIAAAAVANGLDQQLGKDERLFLYLPFEHAEDAAMQQKAVVLISALGDDEYTRYALAHQRVIKRFGRFPHRNATLGRASTPEEVAFLNEPGASF